jgi:hypothetical protein
VTRLVAQGHTVLILDYENHPEEWARRYFGLAGVDGADRVKHVSPIAPGFKGPHGPIWQAARVLRNLTYELDATYLVIDSAVTACGGADPMEPGTPARYSEALQEIDLPALSLAHVTKADDLRYPFGSIFWHNLARVTWSLSKASGGHLELVNRKANNYENQGRYEVTTTWIEGVLREVSERGFTAALSDRIDEVLADGPLTATEIVDRLNEDTEAGESDVKADSVAKALRRGVGGLAARFTVEGTGKVATWRRVT